MTKRYKTDNKLEGQYQPGSKNKVLGNILEIISKEEMDDIELSLLNMLYKNVLDSVDMDQVITTNDLCEWHRKWLGNVYK